MARRHVRLLIILARCEDFFTPKSLISVSENSSKSSTPWNFWNASWYSSKSSSRSHTAMSLCFAADTTPFCLFRRVFDRRGSDPKRVQDKSENSKDFVYLLPITTDGVIKQRKKGTIERKTKDCHHFLIFACYDTDLVKLAKFPGLSWKKKTENHWFFMLKNFGTIKIEKIWNKQKILGLKKLETFP